MITLDTRDRRDGPSTPPALRRLRADTVELHHMLDARMDVVARLTDPARRGDLLARYADLHVPAAAVLQQALSAIEGLDLGARLRSGDLDRHRRDGALPAFPSPTSPANALGMLYVLEGSTLGGRVILRQIGTRADDVDLGFLDPYGTEAGDRWRAFLGVIDREIGDDPALLDELSAGAVRAFVHAATVLCA